MQTLFKIYIKKRTYASLPRVAEGRNWLCVPFWAILANCTKNWIKYFLGQYLNIWHIRITFPATLIFICQKTQRWDLVIWAQKQLEHGGGALPMSSSDSFFSWGNSSSQLDPDGGKHKNKPKNPKPTTEPSSYSFHNPHLFWISLVTWKWCYPNVLFFFS